MDISWRRLIGLSCLVSLTIAGCTTPVAPTRCGDGVSNAGEGCDDGNVASGDGCSALCAVEIGPDVGSGTDSGPALDAPATLDASTTLDVGGALDGPADDVATTDVGPLPDGAIGAACGSRGTGPCTPGLDCVFPIASDCGRSGGAGTCQLRPTSCTREFAPVCGCDGRDYSNECEAHRATTSASSSGMCPVGCDPDLVTCDAIPPRCAVGEVGRVVAGCWGGCVAITMCVCATTADCPSGSSCGALGRCL